MAVFKSWFITTDTASIEDISDIITLFRNIWYNKRKPGGLRHKNCWAILASMFYVVAYIFMV